MKNRNAVNEETLKKPYIWMIVLCSTFIACSLGLCTNAYGVFYTPISQALGVSRSSITMHQSITNFATALASPFVVRLLKKVHIRVLTCCGVIITSATFFLMAIVTKTWMLNVLGLFRGIGCACFALPIATTLLGNWFQKKLGVIMGISLSFSGIAGAIFSPILSHIILNSGYQTASVVCAAFILLSLLPGCLFFVELHPEAKGLRPFGAEEQFRSGAAAQMQDKPAAPVKYSMGIFILIALFAFFAAALTGMSQHLTGFSEKIGVGIAFGATMISFTMIGNVSGKFLVGWLSDQIGLFWAFSIVSVVSGTGVFLFIIAGQSMILLLIGSLLFGMAYSLTAIGVPSLVRYVYGNAQYAERYSAFSVVSSISFSVSVAALGYLVELPAFRLGLCLPVIAMCGGCLFILQFIKRRDQRYG
ncbi:MAG: MFS transporter [Oscillospiraceae bacterium]|nr:MFS transporter [Oscillospiraceae bacterium]